MGEGIVGRSCPWYGLDGREGRVAFGRVFGGVADRGILGPPGRDRKIPGCLARLVVVASASASE